MRLFLCEKPSQGKDIGRILGATQRGEGCLNGSGVTVTWCIGHLVEAAAPEVYDAALKRWSLEQLPIIPQHWRVEVKPKTATQFKVVKALLAKATQVLEQACGHPFHLLPIELAQQTTGAGTVFLRWRRHDRSAMGVALWRELIASSSTPVNLLADLHAIELQRITLNMQISLLHTLGRQAQECASKAAEADDAYLHRLTSVPAAMRDR